MVHGCVNAVVDVTDVIDVGMSLSMSMSMLRSCYVSWRCVMLSNVVDVDIVLFTP
jgi:hypothetical protein